MNPSLVALKKLIVATTAYYGQQFDPTVIAMFANDLADLPLERVEQALFEIRRDPKIIRFPLPAVIRDRIEPFQLSDEALAQQAVSRLVEAISRFGWNHPEDAKAYIGELGWHVVQREGGWQNICSILDQDNIGQLRAQWRDLAISSARLSRVGKLEAGPILPRSNYQRISTAPEEHQLQKLHVQLDELKKQDGDKK